MNDYEVRSAEISAAKTLKEIYKNVPDSGLELLRLIESIPNWETYLTSKQLEVARSYIKCLNTCEVDYQLNLRTGTTRQRLFGSATSRGALGKLQEVKSRLEKQGFYEKQKRIAQKQDKPKVKKSYLTVKTKEQIRELIKLVVEIPDYEKYLTSSQKEKVFQFLRLRSIKGCAKYFDVEETSFKQSLLGKSGTGGVLGRLKEAAQKTMVNDWKDI